MKHRQSSIFSSLAYAFQIPLLRPTLPPSTSTTISSLPSSKQFTTTSPLSKRTAGPVVDKRVTIIRYSLYHPITLSPRALRFSRNRHLRHWTIQRAWSLYQSTLRTERNLELERQYNSMRSAVEELRTGTEDEGKLYRQAMSKKGLKGGRSDIGTTGRGERGERGRVVKGMESGVPVEYGRGLVESLGKGGWDDGWKR